MGMKPFSLTLDDETYDALRFAGFQRKALMSSLVRLGIKMVLEDESIGKDLPYQGRANAENVYSRAGRRCGCKR